MAFIDFSEIKRTVSYGQAIAKLGLDLKQTGNQWRGACPTCNRGGDRALVLTESKGWYCHANGAGGDVIALASHILEVPVKEAAAFLVGKVPTSKVLGTSTAKSVPTVPKSEQGEDVGDRTPQPSSLENVAARLLHEHEDVQALGISPETAKSLGIGFDKKGMMRGRVLFPLYKNGELVGFLGYGDGNVKLPPNLIDVSNVIKLVKTK